MNIGEMADTLKKRNTVIGTPFFLAPEIIQEVRSMAVAPADHL
jgi:serine/threonine protein kinase